MERATRSKRLGLAMILGSAVAISGTAVVRALESADDPVAFRPNPARKDASLPRGPVNLFQVLQTIADATGVTVCYKGDDPPEKTIELTRALEKPDAKVAGEVLKANGYELSEAQFRGKTVSWVQKLILPSRTKGKISRPADGPAAAGPQLDSGKPAPESSPEPGPRVGSQLSLYSRETGSGARYVVTLETESRKEAEEALSLLRAHRQARAAGQSK